MFTLVFPNENIVFVVLAHKPGWMFAKCIGSSDQPTFAEIVILKLQDY